MYYRQYNSNGRLHLAYIVYETLKNATRLYVWFCPNLAFLVRFPWYYFIDIFLIRFGDSKHTGYNTEYMVNGFFEYIQYRNELFGLVLN